MRRNTQSSKYVTWLPVIAVLALFAFVESIDLYKDIASANWPSTTGDVFFVNVPAPKSYSIPEWGPVFHPLRDQQVRFNYVVEGKRYESENMSFGFTFSENIETITTIEPNHILAKVYYNISKPEESALVPGPKIPNICLVVVPILLIIWLAKYIRKENNEAQQRGGTQAAR